MYTCIRTCRHAYACTHTQQIHVHINTFKATKDIAAGQEIFIRYGSAQWFECRNIPHADVDSARTMWRPDLHPLPCRQSVAQATGADGRHSFAVRKAVPSGTVLEISLCVEVSLNIVNQFPVLWDFVLIGETENDRTGCQQTSASSRAHAACVLQIKAKEILLENLLNRFCISFLHSLSSNAQTRNHPKPVLGLGFCISFLHSLTLFQCPNP